MKLADKIIILLAAVFIISGFCYALHVYQGYKKGREAYQNLEKAYILQIPDDDPGKKNPSAGNQAKDKKEFEFPEDAPEREQIDWENLLADYADVVAWIQLPALELSYPVMQAEDNEYYLHRAPDGSDLFAGSIFMDCMCSPSLLNYNTIFYGHNMRDGTMFARLKEYNDPEVLSSCPYFWIYTPECDYLYRIFSVHTAIPGESTYTIRFADQKARTDWAKEMEKASEINDEAEITSETRVVTLSTCTENASMRQVVQGYLISIE